MTGVAELMILFVFRLDSKHCDHPKAAGCGIPETGAIGDAELPNRPRTTP